MRRILSVAVVVAALTLSAQGRQTPQGIFPTVDPVIDALWTGFDMPQAQQHVEFISKHWRLPGNAGYDTSLDRIQARLTGGGYTLVKTAVAGATAARLLVDEYPNTESGGWDHTVGTLALARSTTNARDDEVVLSKEKDRLALCINSFSTPAEGVLAPLYDVGRGDRDEDYAGKSLKGAVVLGDADIGQLWRRAVTNGGAIGVISTSLPRYISPDPPGAKPTPRDQWDILQWGSIPYDAARKGFGFKASPRAAARLRQAIASTMQVKPGEDQTRPSDHAMVRVTIQSSFSPKPNRTLIAEIPGRVAPGERVILAAHVQEPGANDNASGVATLAELAVSLEAGIRAGRIPPPGRTLTFLFLNEIGGSRRWLQDHAADAKNVRYMISMDMTGEDVAKTGGSFLVERWPDPGAVWDRPWDPHSEWGRGNVKAEQLKGDLINDAHLAVCERVAGKTGWVVKTNPYEGGSDHTVFGSAGVPSILDWHFTDRYYHTNFDTPDKTSSAEMRNVGVCAAVTAWMFGSADGALALSVAELVAAAGKTRIALEEREGAKLAAADKDPAAAKTRESQIIAAWRKWYAEAVRSVSRLVVGTPPADFASKLEGLAKPFDAVRLPDLAATPDADPEPAAEPSEEAAERRGGQVPAASPQQRTSEPASDARVFTCGSDMVLSSAIPLRWDTVALAGDSRGFAPCPGVHSDSHRERREATVIAAALTSRDPALRRIAVVSLGRMGEPAALFVKLLADEDANVRQAAAEAIAESLAGRSGELRQAAKLDVKRFAEGKSALTARLSIEKDDAVAGALLATLGRLRYPDDVSRDEVEVLLANAATVKSPPARILGVTKGLEALIRGNPKRPVKLETREKLRLLAVTGPTTVPLPAAGDARSAQAPGDLLNLARSRRLALTALQTARDENVDTLVRAATDADWQVRRLVALRLDAARPELDQTVDRLAADPAFQVRYEMTNVFARAATRSGDCSRLLPYLTDREMTVVLRAIDVLPAACGRDTTAIAPLGKWAAGNLNTPLDARTWHAPAHALEALARLSPDTGRPYLAHAAAHQIWQVRARAAAAAGTFKDGDTARRLASDREPNVRTAALETLISLQHPERFAAAVDALKLDDHQLIRTAAMALRGAPENGRAEVVNQLLATLRRLTGSLSDTSRDPRVAILERLGELLPVDRASDLDTYREDFDPKVREAASSALAKLIQTGIRPAGAIKHRYPFQPDLKVLPSAATITMDGGAVIELQLLGRDAPVTVARFAELARAGHYNGLTFHRVVPNFVIQGGSPGANEYAGVARYMRDEVGLEHHTRGAVGISTRGPDTGDAQIFIDLVDIPRLDHAYTVFARVVSGLDVVDRILEGATITSIIVK
jgi:aminopeptidase YwaD